MNSKVKWNAKYNSSSAFYKVPDIFLQSNVDLLKKGSVLDFACGTGRNAIWLAQRGFSVTGADISEIGLGKLNVFANEIQVEISTFEANLEDLDEIDALGLYDNIIIHMYKPSHDVLTKLPDLLNEEGIILICTHNWKQVEAGKFKKEFCLNKNELIGLNWKMKLVKQASFETNQGHYDGYIFSK